MSAVGARDALERAGEQVSAQDLAAAVCVAIATGAYLSVLYEVVTVVGTGLLLVVAVAAAVGLAGVLRALPWKYATGLAVTLLVAGLAYYLTAIPPAYLDVLSVSRVVQDTVALLTGFSVLRMPAAGTWALAVAPAPTFLVAYLGFRGQFTRAAGVAGLALGFFVLTGDSATTTTLVGVLAAAGAVGFGTLADHGASRRQTEVLAAVLAVMIVASASVTAVPGGRSPLVPSSTTAPTGSLLSTGGYVGVGGSIELSPKVQFVVESEQPEYWRVAAYNRFTGNGWVQTSGVGAAGETPPATGERIRHRVTAKRTLDVLPAAAVPQTVIGVDADVTEGGLLQSGPTLSEGDSYQVYSRVPLDDPGVLAEETGQAPTTIRDRYLQTPESTSDQVVDLAASVTDDVESNYGKAAAVERWLENNKEYSLDARDPSGNLVNEFVLNDEVGYCTYYASSMAVMLRSQGVPARFVVGYTPGQRVSEDEWVVRGIDSHAWVEVYVPNRGWVRFDPTPGTERQTTEQQHVTAARQSGVEGVDAAGSENGTWTPPAPTTTTPSPDGDEGGQNETQDPPDRRSEYGLGDLDRTTADIDNVTAPAGVGDGGSGSDSVPSAPTLPPLTTLAVWGVLLVGLAAGARYTGAADRAYRSLWLRWLPSGEPADEIEGAFERVEYVLERRYRERRAGETIREYVESVRPGDRAERVAAIRERARYAGEATTEQADEAKSLAKSLAAEYSRLPGPRRGDSV